MRVFAGCAAGVLALFAVSSLAGGPASAQISGGLVKIGVLNDESGPYAALAGPGSRVAALMAVQDFGAAAKGLKVETVFADHQNKAGIGAKIARDWYDLEMVDVIVDVSTSSVALAINQIAREKGKALLVSGGGSSDLTANYVFGLGLERDVEAVVLGNGGKVLGKARHPFPTSDFSSFLLEAQASQAKIIGLANAGGDTTNAIEQGTRLGLVQRGQHFAGLLVFLTDVHGLGLR